MKPIYAIALEHRHEGWYALELTLKRDAKGIKLVAERELKSQRNYEDALRAARNAEHACWFLGEPPR